MTLGAGAMRSSSKQIRDAERHYIHASTGDYENEEAKETRDEGEKQHVAAFVSYADEYSGDLTPDSSLRHSQVSECSYGGGRNICRKKHPPLLGWCIKI